MRIVIQRVTHANVRIHGSLRAEIGGGLLALVGFSKVDTELCLKPALEKLLNLRIFSDSQGRFSESLKDKQGELLLVPQFTLFADCSQGRRPFFGAALAPTEAEALFQKLILLAQEMSTGKVAAGEFGANMQVTLENDGPVTIWLDDL